MKNFLLILFLTLVLFLPVRASGDNLIPCIYMDVGFNNWLYPAMRYSFYAPLTHSLIPSKCSSCTATFTRSTTKYCKDYQGIYVQVAIDEPCFEGARRISENNWSDLDAGGSPISDSTLKGIMIEGQRTNYALYSRDLTQAGSWTPTNITPVKNATGIDGTANSASTLTATADNGTILQAITRSSTARVTGAFVKRKTGTGNIYMTQDNGGTWTQITVTSSWALQQIPSATLANPIIGFKIATSGDEIYVDMVQHEEATLISSPIPTTTVSVTRTTEERQPQYDIMSGLFADQSTSEQLENNGFESDLTDWATTVGDGSITIDTVTVHSGSKSVKLTCGGANYTRVYQAHGVLPREVWKIGGWIYGDGINPSHFKVQDNTHGVSIIPQTSTGITASEWTYWEQIFTIPDGCVSINTYFYAPIVTGGHTYWDDCTVKLVKQPYSKTEGTAIVYATLGWSSAENPTGTLRQIIGLTDIASVGLCYFYNGGTLKTHDGTQNAIKSIPWAKNTLYKIAVKWSEITGKMNIGIIEADSTWDASAWATESNFDGNYTQMSPWKMWIGGNMVTSLNVKNLRIFNFILSDSQINNY